MSWDRAKTRHRDLLIEAELKPRGQTQVGLTLATLKSPSKGTGLLPHQFHPIPRSQVPDQSDSSQALPSVMHLIQVTPRHPSRLLSLPVPRPTQSPHHQDAAHPDFVPLPQEGWQTVSVLLTQRGPLLKEHHILTQRLQSLLEEVERCALGPNER